MRDVDIPSLRKMLDKRQREIVYFIDVRTIREYETGHIPGFRWFPGGQVVQRSDDVLAAKHCPVVFACDGKARATITASWYRQFGFEEVFVVQGGTRAMQTNCFACRFIRITPTYPPASSRSVLSDLLAFSCIRYVSTHGRSPLLSNVPWNDVEFPDFTTKYPMTL